MAIEQKVSAAPSVRRLPSYLYIIRQLQREGDAYISGTVIAQELNLDPIQVRKDLAITGIIGKPKKGYLIDSLITAIERFLGWDVPRDAILVGVGNLGTALLGYREFQLHGLRLVAAFDRDPRKIGGQVQGIPVYDLAALEPAIRSWGVKIAILTVPAGVAQEVTDLLVQGGIEALWNFTTIKLKVPGQVVVQQEDLSSGYALLCVKMQAKPLDEDYDAPAS